MKLIGISIFERNSKRGVAEKRALLTDGLDKLDIIQGDQEVNAFLDDPLALDPRLTIVLVSREGLAKTAKGREKRLRQCAEKGVKIQLLGEGAALYDTDEKIAEFRALSVAEQRGNDARGRAKKGKVGRPKGIAITDEAKAAVCALWWSDNPKGGVEALNLARQLTGQDVQRHHIKYWCSPTRTKPEEK